MHDDLEWSANKPLPLQIYLFRIEFIENKKKEPSYEHY
jgi:hypothetical protein